MPSSRKPKPPNAVNNLAKTKAGEHMARRPIEKKKKTSNNEPLPLQIFPLERHFFKKPLRPALPKTGRR